MKKYDIVIKTGEYTARDGSTKSSNKKIGEVHQSDKGNTYIMLDAVYLSTQVNLIANKEQKDKIICSLFETKEQPRAGKQAREDKPVHQAGFVDDELPF